MRACPTLWNAAGTLRFPGIAVPRHGRRRHAFDRAGRGSFATAKNRLQVLEQQKQVKRIAGTGFELPVQIPLTRRFIFCVNQQRADACNVGGLGGAQQGVPEQSPPKTFSLMGLIHCQPRQHHDRHGMTRQAFQNPQSRIGWLGAAHCETVKTGNLPLRAAHVGLRAIGLPAGQCKPLKKLIERGVATVKAISVIASGKLADLTVNGRIQPSTPGCVSNFLSRGLDLTGRSSAA